MTSDETTAPAWKPKKSTLAILALLGVLPAVALIVLTLSRPEMPAAWQQLRLGMTRGEVTALTGAPFEPDTADPELDLERVVHRGESWFGEWAWLLKAQFGEDDRLEQGKAVFVSRRVGMISTERPIERTRGDSP